MGVHSYISQDFHTDKHQYLMWANKYIRLSSTILHTCRQTDRHSSSWHGPSSKMAQLKKKKKKGPRPLPVAKYSAQVYPRRRPSVCACVCFGYFCCSLVAGSSTFAFQLHHLGYIKSNRSAFNPWKCPAETGGHASSWIKVTDEHPHTHTFTLTCTQTQPLSCIYIAPNSVYLPISLVLSLNL